MKTYRVPMAASTAVKLGAGFKLNSGSLTVCSALTFRVFKDHRLVGVGICHRAFESSDYFKRSVKESLTQFGPIESLELTLVKIQTAPDTLVHDIEPDDKDLGAIPKGSHSDTLIALRHDISFVGAKIDTKELMKPAEVAP